MRKLGWSTLGKPKGSQTEAVQSHRSVGTAANRGEVNEQRAREIQIQMEEEQACLALEKQRAEEEAHKRVIARRNTESDIQSTRGYLAREWQKLEHSENIDTELL
ncbi:hypothetical protein EDD85DRAFT_1016445 [Armillaria nabsnona]|nr:hypothetical protein EDD85DRAFT_1016445 [Armillaria nabsnona]